MIDTKPDRNPVRVLHIDDSGTTRLAVAALLRAADIDVISAPDGPAGLEVAREQRPDVVLLDVNLPGMDGFAVCRALKQDETTVAIPVVHLSETFTAAADRIHGIQNGADWYLTQPVEPVELVATIRALARLHAAEERALATKERFRALVEHSSELIAVVGRDQAFTFLSPLVEQLIAGGGPVVRQHPCALVHPDDRASVADAFLALDPAGSTTVVARVGDETSGWRWMEALLSDLRHVPAVDGVVVNARDVTERKAAEDLVHDQRAILEQVARSAPLEQTIERISRFVEDHAGLPCRLDLSSTPPAVQVEGWLDIPITAYRTGDDLGVLSIGGGGGTEAQVSAVAQLAAELAGIAIERDRDEHKLAWQAMHDPLTDLPNRHLFLDRLAQALARGSRDGTSVAVLFLDLDHFKVVNDSLGHAAGDRVLAATSDRLRQLARATDTVARFGGDEFIVLCPDVVGEEDALAVAQRLVESCSDPHGLGDQSIKLSASCGVAIGRPGDQDSDALLRDADAAMYQAKAQGRARVCLFDSELGARARGRLELEVALRKAVANGELWVAFQPQVELSSGTVVGYEALARWDRADGTSVSPGEFIPIAEESDLIVDLGGLVLDRACEMARALGGDDAPRVSVNLSVRQFARSDVVAIVRDALERSGLSPRRLLLEITESALVEEAQSLVDALRQLRDMGVQIAIDDFGTRYSSLVYLRSLPVDEVKIDMSFVFGVDRLPEDRAIVAAVVSLARELGARSVAEGVERATQAEVLAELGCPLGQGFYFARPLPAHELPPAPTSTGGATVG